MKPLLKAFFLKPGALKMSSVQAVVLKLHVINLCPDSARHPYPIWPHPLCVLSLLVSSRPLWSLRVSASLGFLGCLWSCCLAFQAQSRFLDACAFLLPGYLQEDHKLLSTRGLLKLQTILIAVIYAVSKGIMLNPLLLFKCRCVSPRLISDAMF